MHDFIFLKLSMWSTSLKNLLGLCPWLQLLDGQTVYEAAVFCLELFCQYEKGVLRVSI